MKFAIVRKVDAENNRELLNASTSNSFDEVRTDDSGSFFFFSFKGETPKVFESFPIVSLDKAKELLQLSVEQLNEQIKYRYLGTDEEGATISRPKAAKKGWKAQFHSIRISTSTENGVYSKKRDGTDTGFCTYTMKDSQGEVTIDPQQCVETIVTWEPQHDMEIVGGQALQKEPPNSNIWMWVTAAAHIPEMFGGNITFTEGGINLQDIGVGGVVDFDGRASKYIKYDPQNHSGTFEICLKHNAGVQHSFTLIFELFKE